MPLPVLIYHKTWHNMCCYLHQSSVAKFSLEEIMSVLVEKCCHLTEDSNSWWGRGWSVISKSICWLLDWSPDPELVWAGYQAWHSTQGLRRHRRQGWSVPWKHGVYIYQLWWWWWWQIQCIWRVDNLDDVTLIGDIDGHLQKGQTAWLMFWSVTTCRKNDWKC